MASVVFYLSSGCSILLVEASDMVVLRFRLERNACLSVDCSFTVCTGGMKVKTTLYTCCLGSKSLWNYCMS